MRKKMNKQVLINARKVRGWTQQQAADAIGCSRYSVVQYESGSVAANDSTIKRIAKVYHLSVEELTQPEIFNLYAELSDILDKLEGDEVAMVHDKVLDEKYRNQIYFVISLLLDHLGKYFQTGS